MSRKGSNLGLTLAAVTGQVGCVTLVLTLGAILLGLQLDRIFDTRPVLTIGLTIASLPVTLISIFAIVRWTTAKMLNTEEKLESSEEDDLDRRKT